MYFIYTNFQFSNSHQSVIQNYKLYYVLIGGRYAGRHYIAAFEDLQVLVVLDHRDAS